MTTSMTTPMTTPPPELPAAVPTCCSAHRRLAGYQGRYGYAPALLSRLSCKEARLCDALDCVIAMGATETLTELLGLVLDRTDERVREERAQRACDVANATDKRDEALAQLADVRADRDKARSELTDALAQLNGDVMRDRDGLAATCVTLTEQRDEARAWLERLERDHDAALASHAELLKQIGETKAERDAARADVAVLTAHVEVHRQSIEHLQGERDELLMLIGRHVFEQRRDRVAQVERGTGAHPPQDQQLRRPPGSLVPDLQDGRLVYRAAT